jgi:hypothetical protein
LNPLEELVGSGEVLGALGSGALALPIAAGKGLYKGIRKGYGTKAGTDEAQRVMAEALEQMTYAPRTRAGRGQLETIGRAFENAKIPPYSPVGRLSAPVPGAGRLIASEAADAAKESIRSGATGSMAMAVKEPGGHFTDQSRRRLALLLRAFQPGHNELIPPHITEWADTAIPRYLGKHAGTVKDPAKGLRLGEATYEQVMDKSLKAKPASRYTTDEATMPVTARPHELVWDFKPKRELQDFLRHAGDMAPNFAPDDLKRMDIPTLLRKVQEMDARKTKAVAKSGDARQEAALRITNEHPAPPVLETDLGKWLQFKQGMDPEYVKRGLSVDTCIGDHCVASIGHGRPQMGYPGHVPVRDLVTGRNPLAMEDGGRHVRDTTSYIESVLQGKGDIYSLRTPKGIPVATMETQAGKNEVPRSFVRDKLMNKSNYLQWQRAMREMGVPREQHAPPMPSSRLSSSSILEIPELGQMNPEQMRGLVGNIGGGKISPVRGVLTPPQIASINEMFPQYAENLKRYMDNPPHEVNQYKGFKNYPVSPRYSQMTTDMLRQQMQANAIQPNLARGVHDLERGGIAGSKEGRIQSLPELINEVQSRGQLGTRGLYGPGGERNTAGLLAEVKQLMGKEHLAPDDANIVRELMRVLRDAQQ